MIDVPNKFIYTMPYIVHAPFVFGNCVFGAYAFFMCGSYDSNRNVLFVQQKTFQIDVKAPNGRQSKKKSHTPSR